MQTLLVSLVMAAVSGLAFLAVKHPPIYRRLFGSIYVLSSSLFLALVAWSSAVDLTLATLIGFIDPNKYADAKANVALFSLPLPWLLAAWVLGLAYIFFLEWLAKQVTESQNTAASPNPSD